MISPRATYRLQFNANFTFAEAARLVPYLAELGVSHLYASPWLKARAGSLHGYDIIDHTAFNPEVGSDVDFEWLSAALAEHGLGHILDFVPNHMGIAQADNEWWLDVLEWGRASPYANWFDIDWAPTEPRLRNKVLLPFLGDHYGNVLEAGELAVRFDADSGSYSVWYYGHRFPVAPRDYATLIRAGRANVDGGAGAELEDLAAAATQLGPAASASGRRVAQLRAQAMALKERLAALAVEYPAARAALEHGAAALGGVAGQPESFRALHRLLERQAYRLAYWRVAADEINYRRFFDINDLAGIRVEDPALFERIHRLVQRLLREGKLDGLRIDHIDGLFNPAQYCQRLTRLASRPVYLVVEKILARHERLRANWPVAGTTGYDFMNQVNNLLIDPAAERVLTRSWQRFIGRADTFDDVLYAARKQVIRTKLSSELHVLARDLNRIAEQHWSTRDYTLETLTHALEEVVACFPVYRTYVDARGASAEDRRDIDWAVAQARKQWDKPDEAIFDFVCAALTTDLVEAPRSGYRRKQVVRFAMKFQQYTSPVTAKGFEDTALYRYNRLVGLNDVGADPRQFGCPPAAFHHANIERAAHWPQAMLATATHDTKRGEDVRARLAALSAVPAEWHREVRRWARFNASKKQTVDGRPAPGRNDEYLLYQTLIGAWPVEMMAAPWPAAAADDFVARIQAYMNKAIREAKVSSSWTNPHAEYERATTDFISRILDPVGARLFLDAFLPLQGRVAGIGMHNSLVQLVLKMTCPGVPDIYQGSELWDLSLVDPDNRRPVDFARRRALLRQVKALDALAPAQRAAEVAVLREHWHDGAIKLYMLHALLQLRAARSAVFAQGNYRPLELEGADAERAIAFVREHEGVQVIVAAMLPAARESAVAEINVCPPADAVPSFADIFTGRQFTPAPRLSAQDLFAVLPVAVLCGEIGRNKLERQT